MSKLFGYLSYRDVDVAIKWLEALGFETSAGSSATARRQLQSSALRSTVVIGTVAGLADEPK